MTGRFRPLTPGRARGVIWTSRRPILKAIRDTSTASTRPCTGADRSGVIAELIEIKNEQARCVPARPRGDMMRRLACAIPVRCRSDHRAHLA
jgi:hypothetical protein